QDIRPEIKPATAAQWRPATTACRHTRACWYAANRARARNCRFRMQTPTMLPGARCCCARREYTAQPALTVGQKAVPMQAVGRAQTRAYVPGRQAEADRL